MPFSVAIHNLKQSFCSDAAAGAGAGVDVVVVMPLHAVIYAY